MIGLSKEEKLKMLYVWIKQDVISFSQFENLIKTINE